VPYFFLLFGLQAAEKYDKPESGVFAQPAGQGADGQSTA
jgi:hypothetical protein